MRTIKFFSPIVVLGAVLFSVSAFANSTASQQMNHAMHHDMGDMAHHAEMQQDQAQLKKAQAKPTESAHQAYQKLTQNCEAHSTERHAKMHKDASVAPCKMVESKGDTHAHH